MKPITSFALLSALATLASQGAVTDPVGYVTESLVSGFNFVGLTVHESATISGDFETIGSGTATDTDADFDAALAAGTTYILEVDGALGITETIAAWAGDTLTTETDLSGTLVGGETYTLRPAATLESVFGAAGENIAHGNFGTSGAEQVWLFNGSGYDKYYYDDFSPNGFAASWVQLEPVSQDIAAPEDVVLPYDVGFLIVAENPRDIVLTGEVKLQPTELNLVTGFNFASSVAPVSATLATSFGAAGENLRHGNFGTSGADQVWVFNGAGYDKYYYDDFSPNGFAASWVQIEPASQDIADPTTVSVPSGFLLVAESAGDVTQGIPAYDTL